MVRPGPKGGREGRLARALGSKGPRPTYNRARIDVYGYVQHGYLESQTSMERDIAVTRCRCMFIFFLFATRSESAKTAAPHTKVHGSAVCSRLCACAALPLSVHGYWLPLPMGAEVITRQVRDQGVQPWTRKQECDC